MLEITLSAHILTKALNFFTNDSKVVRNVYCAILRSKHGKHLCHYNFEFEICFIQATMAAIYGMMLLRGQIHDFRPAIVIENIAIIQPLANRGIKLCLGLKG